MKAIQNNRLHHRKWLKSNLEQQRAYESRNDNATATGTDINNRPEHPLRQSLYAGFEYAIQRDGSSLAEIQRRERIRDNDGSMDIDSEASSLANNTGQHGVGVNNSRPRLSLTQIESKCRDSFHKYQQREKLPERPVCNVAPDFPAANNAPAQAPNNICNSMPPPPPPQPSLSTGESNYSIQSNVNSTSTPYVNPYSKNKVATDQRPPLNPTQHPGTSITLFL